MNRTVMEANHGKMPVDTLTTSFDNRHCQLTPQSNYPVLSDIIRIDHELYSIGDFLILSFHPLLYTGFGLTFLGLWGIVKKK